MSAYQQYPAFCCSTAPSRAASAPADIHNPLFLTEIDENVLLPDDHHHHHRYDYCVSPLSTWQRCDGPAKSTTAPPPRGRTVEGDTLADTAVTLPTAKADTTPPQRLCSPDNAVAFVSSNSNAAPLRCDCTKVYFDDDEAKVVQSRVVDNEVPLTPQWREQQVAALHDTDAFPVALPLPPSPHSVGDGCLGKSRGARRHSPVRGANVEGEGEQRTPTSAALRASGEDDESGVGTTADYAAVVSTASSFISLLLRTPLYPRRTQRFHDVDAAARGEGVGDTKDDEEGDRAWTASRDTAAKRSSVPTNEQHNVAEVNPLSATPARPLRCHRHATQLAHLLLPVRRELFVSNFSAHLFCRLSESAWRTMTAPAVAPLHNTAAASVADDPLLRHVDESAGEDGLVGGDAAESTRAASPCAEAENRCDPCCLSLYSSFVRPPSPPSPSPSPNPATQPSLALLPPRLPSTLSTLWRTSSWQHQRGYTRLERAVQERRYPRDTSCTTADASNNSNSKKDASLLSCAAAEASSWSSCGETYPSVQSTPRAVLWSPAPPSPGCNRHTIRGSGGGGWGRERVRDENDSVDVARNAAALWAAEQMCV
jgi:hypothetical protein